MNSNSGAEHGPNGGAGDIPATPQPEAELVPHRIPLVPERSDFLEGDAPAADKVEAFLAQALAATGSDAPTTAGALVPWICDALLSNHSVKAYGRDLMDFLRHMQAQGVDPLEVTADHVKLYKRALLEAGRTSATVARRLSVLRGTYQQLAAKGLVSWETAQDIAAVKAPGVQKNSTPSLTQKQAIALLEAIPADTLAGHPRPGDDERLLPHRLPGLGGDRGLRGAPRDRRRRALPPRHREAEQEAAEDPARCRPAGPGLRGAGRHRGGQGGAAVPADDAGRDAVSSGGTWTARPPGGWSRSTARRPGIDPDRLGGRGIGIHSLRKTAINDAIRNGASMHEVREFAGHSRHPHHRGLLRAEGGGRRGGRPADSDPSDGPPR